MSASAWESDCMVADRLRHGDDNSVRHTSAGNLSNRFLEIGERFLLEVGFRGVLSSDDADWPLKMR